MYFSFDGNAVKGSHSKKKYLSHYMSGQALGSSRRMRYSELLENCHMKMVRLVASQLGTSLSRKRNSAELQLLPIDVFSSCYNLKVQFNVGTFTSNHCFCNMKN